MKRYKVEYTISIYVGADSCSEAIEKAADLDYNEFEFEYAEAVEDSFDWDE